MLFVVAAHLFTACSTAPPVGPQINARPADAFGFVTPRAASEVPRVDGTVGPAQILVGDKVIDVPTTLRLDDNLRLRVRTPNNVIEPVNRCWAQVGLEADGHTLRWINSRFSVLQGDPSDPARPTRISIGGRLARVADGVAVLEDSTTVPIDPGIGVDSCNVQSPGTVRATGGVVVTARLDPNTGRVVELQACGPGTS